MNKKHLNLYKKVVKNTKYAIIYAKYAENKEERRSISPAIRRKYTYTAYYRPPYANKRRSGERPYKDLISSRDPRLYVFFRLFAAEEIHGGFFGEKALEPARVLRLGAY